MKSVCSITKFATPQILDIQKIILNYKRQMIDEVIQNFLHVIVKWPSKLSIFFKKNYIEERRERVYSFYSHFYSIEISILFFWLKYLKEFIIFLQIKKIKHL